MPEFYIHCGLHKTGTTSLQHFFALNAQAHLDAGLHYPKAGTHVGGAHHNLAWQLGRDRRYFERFGDVEQMLHQVAAVPRDTVISSEDFESSLLAPERWTQLVAALRELRFFVTFVVYLREPASYLRSLFLENIKHGCGDEFGSVARQILERGSYNFSDWTFQFDYDAIARQLARIEGARVVFRSFENLVDGSIVPDFFDVIGHKLPGGSFSADIEVNVQTDAATLLRHFLRNRQAPYFAPIEHIVAVADMLLGGRELVPKLPARLTEVIKRQRGSNLKQVVDQQSALPSAPRRPASGGWEVNISRLFSWETHVEAMAILEKAPGSGGGKLAALRSGDQGVFENWRNWVAAGL